MKKESLFTTMPKLITTVILIVGIGAVLGVMGYFWAVPESEVIVNDEIENEEIEDDIEEGIITEIKYVCEQETNKNKDGCYIRNARIIALTDYNKAKTICGLTSEPRKDDCNLQILAVADISKLKEKCEDTKDGTEKEQCYNILISKISETDFNEAVKLCEIKSSSKDNCYASVAEKISFTRSAEIYSEALTICDKIDWQELKESCKENCKWNYEYEQEYDETADWKTYRNTIHNYEIKYPDDSVSARELNFDISLATERSNEVVFIIRDDKESEIDKTSCLTIESESLIEEQFNLSLSELISDVTNDFKKKELININGEEVVKLSFEGSSGLEFTNRRSFLDNEDKDIFFIKHNNIIFIMTLYIIQEDKNKINSNRIFNQILSTFKFIEKKETEDWKTYSNKDYGISFQYPSHWKIKNDELSEDKNLFSIIMDGVALRIVGVNEDYEDSGHPGWVGYCAVYNKNIEQFCEEDCTRINSKTAIKLEKEYHGDTTFGYKAYTNASTTFSSVCFEMVLGNLLEEGIDYYSLSEEDIKGAIEKLDENNQVRIIMKDFEKLSQSIKNSN